MATVEGSVEALAQAILNEARGESEELGNRARAEAESIRQRARDEAARERKAILDEASEQVRQLRGQAVATAQMKARTLELGHREELLGRVFQGVAGRLPSVTERSDYGEIVQLLVREALEQLKASSVQLSTDKSTKAALTKERLDSIAKETGVELRLGPKLESATGVVAKTMDGRLQFDNTLETRLARIQGTIRSAVYRVLIGEGG